jgi:hypothetical protein
MTSMTRAVLGPWLLLGALSACTSTPSAPARDLQLQTSFMLQPGDERYMCYRMNVKDDAFITKIATTAALGVHHENLKTTEVSLGGGR